MVIPYSAQIKIMLINVKNVLELGGLVSYNDKDVPDRDSTPDNQVPGEDDQDEAPVILSISTGRAKVYFGLGFLVLVTAAAGIVLIKKYVL